MPYTLKDVDKHNKGLSKKQKAQWVAVANSVLDKCIKNGDDESTCAASAIKQANGVVSTNQLHVNVANTGYVIRQETHQGRNHIIVPVVMMVEGVHSGSKGALLHQADELGKFPASWDGIPVVINHPTDNEGNNVSANSPEIIDSEVTVGRVYHAHMVDSKLVAEAYLDEAKLNEASPNALSAIMSGNPLEVSIGVFTDEEEVPGVWHDEQYSAVAINHRPDHLALLPGGTGACSWEDGCGIRVNQKKEGGNVIMKNEKLIDAIKTLNLNNFTINEINTNEEGYNVKMEILRRLVDSLDDQKVYHYLEEVYDQYFIYCERLKEGGESKLFRQDYRIVEDQTELLGDPVEVIKKIDIEYSPIQSNIKRTKFNINSKGGSKMNGKEGCGQCMEKIVAIINTNAAGMTADNREWLLTQEEATLDMLLSKKPVENKVEVNTLTSEQIINAMSAEDKAALAFGRRQLAEKRATMVKGIQDNTSKELWPDAVLNALSEDFLEKLYTSVNVNTESDVNYDLNANSRHIDTNAEEGLYPVDITFDAKK